MMLRSLRTIVTTWPFLLSLLVLLVNDAWLKHAYPGLLTGKLSDFSGIAVVSLLLATHQHRQRLVYGLIILAFSWWKSPLSQPAIDVINTFLPAPVGRTVDYTDLLAFLVMPACAVVTARPLAFALPSHTLRRLLVAPVVAFTVLGLMATSVIPTRQDYQVRGTDRAPDLDREAIAKTISQVAAQHGLKCEDSTNRVNCGSFRGNGMSLWYIFTGAKSLSFQVLAFPGGLFFGPSGQEKADRLRNDIKSHLASSYENLEYVEQLDPKPNGTR